MLNEGPTRMPHVVLSCLEGPPNLSVAKPALIGRLPNACQQSYQTLPASPAPWKCSWGCH